MKPRILALCGVIAPLLFVLMAVLGGAMRPGYSHISDTVSELLSPGSPNRLFLGMLFTVYAFLMAIFGIGLLVFVRSREPSKQLGSISAVLFIVAGLVNVTIATVFPQDPWGSPFTFAGKMHMILSGVIGILQILSIVLLGIWLIRTGVSPGLGAYSIFTAVVVSILIGVFLMKAGTPLMGLAERILIFAGLLWTFVIAVWIVKKTTNQDSEVLKY